MQTWKSSLWVKLTIGATVYLVFIIGLFLHGERQPRPDIKASAIPSPAPTIEDAAGPLPLLSPWDGEVYCVDEYLKQVLNDYESAEYLQWTFPEKVVIKKAPYWQVRLKLRAKNAFGAKIIKVYTFLIQNNVVVKASAS
jgi:hypothetical protein